MSHPLLPHFSFGGTRIATAKMSARGVTRYLQRFLAIIFLGGIIHINLHATTSWQDASGGDFNDGTKWSAGAPDATTTAIFNLGTANAYSITFNLDGNANHLRVDTDKVIFSIGAGANDRTLTLAGSALFGDNTGNNAEATLSRGTLSASGDLHVGQRALGTFTVSDGATASLGGLLHAGFRAGGDGTITVTGADSSITTGNGTNTVGRQGEGRLEVLDSAEVTFGQNLFVGDRAPGGSVLVDNARLEAGFSVQVGRDGGSFTTQQGNGALTIQNGGEMEITRDLIVGTWINSSNQNSGATGTVTVTGTDSKLEAGQTLTIGQGTTNNVNTDYRGILLIEAGGRLTTGGGEPANSYDARVGISGGVGEMTVQGAGSRWVHSSDIGLNSLYVGGTSVGQSGSGTLAIRDGGLVEVDDLVKIYDGSILEMASGRLESTGLSLDAGGRFDLTLAAGDLAQACIALTGEFDPGGADFDFSLDPGFSASIDDVFQIVTFDSMSASTFAGLGEGAVLTSGSRFFQVSYGLELPNAFTLTVIPEPRGVALALVALLFLTVRRGHHRLRG